ncbi:hypothetical protein GCM10022284_37590 [Streptomyces hundungensis]
MPPAIIAGGTFASGVADTIRAGGAFHALAEHADPLSNSLTGGLN